LTRARRALVDATGERDAGDRVKDGVFGATMDVALVNDGPVTVVVDSDDRSK
jgi:D-tyrosyl-tRNA(Tyr) deacylase